MKSQTKIVLLLLFTLLLSSCGNASAATSPAAPAEPLATESPAVEDNASLVAALEAAGGAVETGDLISQPFFSPEGTIIKVNGTDVQVFEYETSEAMENEASQVASDGGAIGTSMVNWIDAPHFYKAGRIIVLYVGSDKTVLDLLEGVLGPQFAGR